MDYLTISALSIIGTSFTFVVGWVLQQGLEKYGYETILADKKKYATASKMEIFLNYTSIAVVGMMFLPYVSYSLYIPNSIIGWINEIMLAIIMVLIVDFINYFYHRGVHEILWLYRKIHYKHHLNKNPKSFSDSTLHHLAEFFITNMIGAAPLLLMWQAPVRTVLYILLQPIQFQINHSGLDVPALLPYMMTPKDHLVHHKTGKNNYCEYFTLMDRLFGTYVSGNKYFT